MRHLLLLSVLVAALAVLSLHLGLRPTAPATVWRALWGEGQDAAELIVRGLRLPRMALALGVGAALGVAGLLTQAALRNPVAEPGLIGVNAGAGFAVVLALSVWQVGSLGLLTLCAAFGALVATALLFGIASGGRSRAGPLRLLLSGVTVAALLSAGTQVAIILDEKAMEDLLFWLSGGFADRPVAALGPALPVMIGAAGIAWLRASVLDVLAADDETAQALGLPVVAARLAMLALAALLAGAAVAVAGPVAFIGLGAPHLARMARVTGHARLLPLAALWGAALALIADILARYLIWPGEAPLSAVTALAGVPLLLALLHRRAPA
ncbi:FecCD family ABC transporter permease [Limimaricola sp.]|uniref:FecCD family ABC transporter permease n=1 Tax=Limimaricola sp. TaxID=2211665 RepID=UPI0040598597